MNELPRYTAEMRARGIRRLAVISGEALWCQQQAEAWQQALEGHWWWVGEQAPTAEGCSPTALKTLLGREFIHGVFDARNGFHAEAFAALAGTLQAGSWLLLLIPPLAEWETRPDRDSLRWSEQAHPVATPHFIRWLRQCLVADPQVLVQQQHRVSVFPANQGWPLWQPQATEQQQLCAQLLSAPPGVSVVTAARGRGKSALAGMLAKNWPGRCWVTAPARVATDVLARFAGEQFHFMAPDRLLTEFPQGPPPEVDWLLIDEAAAIPTSLLNQLIARFPRVLLTTTIQGYEGTGRGFVLKFCAGLPQVRLFTLRQPLRWAAQDPLERWLEKALMFAEPRPVVGKGPLQWRNLSQQAWVSSASQLSALYCLLSSAHYRTSPLDLRRMMDAPGQHFSVVTQQNQVQGGVWLVEEGGLAPSLAAQVWAGTRRPPGNLVAQSLAAHAGLPEAPLLHARRISRIALAPQLRRQGWGRQLVAQAASAAAGCDYLSVSFGFTPELYAFWQACGFRLVRTGSQREASSGCYAAMALRALSPRGEQLIAKARRRFADELGWLLMRLELPGLAAVARAERQPDEQDWLELAGFAFARRPFDSTIAALGRLILHCATPLPLLEMAVLQQRSLEQICRQQGIHGRRALLQRWRQETARGLYALDAAAAEKLRSQILSWQQNQQPAECFPDTYPA